MTNIVRKNQIVIGLLVILICRILLKCDIYTKECFVDSTFSPDLSDKLSKVLEEIRYSASINAKRHLPSPHSELLLGLTVGMDDLKKVPDFREALVDTGTIHVVVVSGYNITLVFLSLTQIIGSVYKKRNAMAVLAITLLYAFLTGFDPPVVRAWLMTATVILGKYYGRKLSMLRVLFISGILMIAFNPNYLFSLSFQLSFSATLSLIMFGNMIQSAVLKLLPFDNVFTRDFSATVSAQILTWPLISYYFGRVSLHSVIVNALLLWTVPLATMSGMLFILAAAVSLIAAKITSWVVYVPLDMFIRAIYSFDSYIKGNVEFEISFLFLVSYFLIALVIYLLYSYFSIRISANAAINLFSDNAREDDY